MSNNLSLFIKAWPELCDFIEKTFTYLTIHARFFDPVFRIKTDNALCSKEETVGGAQ